MTLVTPSSKAIPDITGFESISPALSPSGWVRDAVRVVGDGLPLHSLIAAGRTWNEAITRATRERGPFDTAVVLLSRTDPWVFDSIVANRKILDAIDSLTASTRARAESSMGLARRFWEIESRRMGMLEGGLAERYDAITVVSEADRQIFGSLPTVVSNGVEILPLDDSERSFDVGFWGNLSYFANRDALHVLLEEIWPQIRRMKRDATLMIGGSDAPRSLRAIHGRDGVTLISPMSDRPSLLRRVRVAILPLRYGTGHSNKVLEGGEAGCALVGTSVAFRGFDSIEREATVAESGRELADSVVGLLLDRARSEESAARTRRVIEQEHDRRVTCEEMRRLVRPG